MPSLASSAPSRWLHPLWLLLLWAALYLPGLGDAELKGEEGRRSLPAIEMLESGQWVVPHLNGEPYLRKPPLLNWLIAGAFRLTGEQSEFAARLPSILSVLLMAVLIWQTARRWMPEAQARLGALFWLTTISVIEKGRLAEIEALYVMLVGAAFAFWLREWMGQRRNGWLWGPAACCLGLAMLAKGPSHLLFFYGMVIPVLIAARESRRLFTLAHGLSLLAMVAIFAAWAVPYFHAAAADNAGNVWFSQAGNVIAGGSREWSEWLPNFPSALANALPWLLLAPLFWSRRAVEAVAGRDPRAAQLITATRWPLVIGFVGLMALPGVLPRYTLPLLPWAIFLLALVVPTIPEWGLKWWRGINRAGVVVLLLGMVASPWVIRPASFDLSHWGSVGYLCLLVVLAPLAAYWILRKAPLAIEAQAWATGLLAAGVIALYASVLLPRKAQDDHLRPIAAQLHALTPPGEPIYVIGYTYEPLFFYIQRPLKFEKTPRKIPNNAKQILFRPKHAKRVESRWPQASETSRLEGSDKKVFLLLKLSPETEKNPRPEP